MVGDDALGIAGGAGGVGDGDRIPLVRGAFELRERRVPRDERLVLVFAEALAGTGILAVAHVDDRKRAAVLLAQHAQHLAHHRRELAVGDQHRRLAVLQLPGQQRRIQADVERIQHGIERRYGVVRFHHLRGVAQHGADRGAATHSERAQRRGEARRALARLRPAVAACAVHHGGQIAEHLRGALDEAHR